MAKKAHVDFLNVAVREGVTSLTRQELINFCDKHDLKFPYWIVHNPANVISRGVYRIPVPEEAAQRIDMVGEASRIGVPEADPLFVPYGHFNDIKRIIGSRQFQPFAISGPTGTGKTKFIQQACAHLLRPMVRMNLTSSTDEDMIIGGFRLVNGETRFFKGPAIVAMEQGAVLLIDEYDLGDPEKIMCLQPIAEGSGYHIKQTGEYVSPRPGFTIAATANTKGQGSSTGEYVGTQILNEAFLERFDNSFDQDYPPAKVERDILNLSLGHFCNRKPNSEDKQFVTNLVQWATNIRKGFAEGSQPHSMSTRRLVQVTKTFALFDDRLKAIELCVNRFDHYTRNAFLEFYTKIDAEVAEKAAAVLGVKSGTTPPPDDGLPWGS